MERQTITLNDGFPFYGPLVCRRFLLRLEGVYKDSELGDHRIDVRHIGCNLFANRSAQLSCNAESQG